MAAVQMWRRQWIRSAEQHSPSRGQGEVSATKLHIWLPSTVPIAFTSFMDSFKKYHNINAANGSENDTVWKSQGTHNSALKATRLAQYKEILGIP